MKQKLLPRVLALLCLLCLTTVQSWAQSIVKGNVVDEQGEPVIGASIREAGTTNGTISDLDGNFQLKVGKDASLEVTYVGFVSQQIKVDGRSSIKIVLSEQSNSLNDIVVIGYGQVKKEDLSSSIATLSPKEITKAPGGLSAGLQSEVPGVQITNGKIHIRGVNSVNNTDPLYVVDGMIGGAIPDENNIASIQVLKDAASCAIYGSRGANGVIIITTKRGQAGDVKVEYNGYLGTKNFTKTYDMLSGQDLAELINEEMYNANPSRTDYLSELSDPESIGKGSNMFKEITRRGFFQKHNVSVSGGNQNATFRVTGIYDYDKGTLKSDRNENYTLNFVSDFKKGIFGLGETFTITRSLARSVGDAESGGSSYYLQLANKWSSVLPVYDPTSETGFAGAGVGTDCNNALAEMTYNYRHDETNLMSGNIWVTAEPIKGLVYKFNFGTELQRDMFTQYAGKYNVGAYQHVDRDTYTMYSAKYNRFLYEHTLNYNHQFGKHGLDAMVGVTSEEYKPRSFRGSVRDLPSSAVQDFDATQDATSRTLTSAYTPWSMVSYLARVLYNYDSKYMLTVNFRRDGSSKFSKAHRYGNFPSASAAWRISSEPWMKKLTWLNDLKLRAGYGVIGNSNIGDYLYQETVSFTNQYYYFNRTQNSGALSVTPANPDAKWEQSRTFDAGFDLTALDNRLSFTFDYFYNKTKDMLLQVPIAIAAGYSDASPTLNSGSIKNNGFEFLVAWHDRIGKNWEYNVSANLSTVTNEVTDLGLNSEIYKADGRTRTVVGGSVGRFWGYKTDGLFKTDAEAAAYVNKDGKRLQPNAAAGDLKFVDVNGDGVIDAKDETFIGNPIPDFTYGLAGDVTYHSSVGDFDFSMVWNGSQGNDIYNNTRYFGEGMYHYYNCYASTLDRFRAEDLTFTNPISGKTTFYPKNTNTDMPRAVLGDPNQNMRNSDRYVEDGSYLRLKTLLIGYTLPNRWTSKLGIEKLRFYAGGKNLITITGYSGLDPEVGDSDSSNNMTRGIDGLSTWSAVFPNYREWYFGMQLTF